MFLLEYRCLFHLSTIIMLSYCSCFHDFNMFFRFALSETDLFPIQMDGRFVRFRYHKFLFDNTNALSGVCFSA